MSKILKKHIIFAKAYLESPIKTEKERLSEAAVKAGYKPRGGKRLLGLPDIREYITQSVLTNKENDLSEIESEVEALKTFEKDMDSVYFDTLQDDLNDANIVAQKDIVKFFTSVMQGGDEKRFNSADLKEQMKAAENLAKIHGLYSKDQSVNEPKLPIILETEHVAVGKGYEDFWNFGGRYRVVKGSRGSKKSKTTALWFIYNMMKRPSANLLVVRKVFRTLKDSCFTELRWAIKRIGAESLWECKESPLEITYKPTGQKIFFRGLDNPLKINSISAVTGGICWLWIEEAYEISREDDFNMLDESIRGGEANGAFKQITLTFNPWDERHWLKKRFFDSVESEDILAITKNYTCNEFLDEADLRLFETMKKQNPRRYRIAGLGEWGINEGSIYENWREERFDANSIKLKPVFGLDFGYTNDPSALFCGLLDRENLKLYVFDELYEKRLTNSMLFNRIRESGYSQEVIRADSAEPKSIDELRGLGLTRIRPAKKGPDSIRSGIQKIQNYQIVIHPRCVNFLREIGGYVWEKDQTGRKLNQPAGGEDHLMDAMRYAMEDAGEEVYSFS